MLRLGLGNVASEEEQTSFIEVRTRCGSQDLVRYVLLVLDMGIVVNKSMLV
jgi:hypothetical protein